jgi:di/tricarboxylate transporter
MYIATTVLGSVYDARFISLAYAFRMSNGATVALMYPIVKALVDQGAFSLKAGLYALMLAGSADFSTPIGYQTNLMVYGPGGYRFTDYTKFGFPLQMICMVISVLGCYWAF